MDIKAMTETELKAYGYETMLNHEKQKLFYESFTSQTQKIMNDIAIELKSREKKEN
jgi:hypothetical protein